MAFAAFEQAVLSFIDSYGYAALFVLMLLETAMILHFVPSELIVAVTAARLVHSTATLALVVLDGTIAATLGCLVVYAAASYGGRDFILRHPRLFHVTPERLDRLHATFEKPVGTFLVFVCRMLPGLRAFVSVPAGLAKMDLPRYTAYSTAGNGLFVLAIAYVSSTASAQAWVGAMREWAVANGPFVIALAVLVLAASAWLWWRRHELASRPHRVAMDAWTHAAVLVGGIGILLVALAIVAPGFTARVITAVSDDAAAWATTNGFTAAALVFILGLEALGIGLAALAIGRGLRHLLHRQG